MTSDLRGVFLMSVKRIFVEKRQGFFDIPAQRLLHDLEETFRLTELRAVRLFTRYDVEGLSDEEFEKVQETYEAIAEAE